MRLPSMTTRLFLGFLGLAVLALGFLGTLSTLWFLRQQSTALDQFLVSEATGIANRLEGIVEGLSESSTLGPEDVRAALTRDVEAYLQQRLNRAVPYKTTLLILDERHRVLARSNAALDLSGPAPPLGITEPLVEEVRDRGPPFRVVTAPFALGQGQYGTFRVACLLSGLEPPLHNFLAALAVILGGNLLLLSFLGAGLITLTLRPVQQMSAAASRIGAQGLAARIPLPPGRDHFTRLATTLNGLLERLESDYAYQERLVQDLTHQLKTPLTVLRGRNELALNSALDERAWREVIEDNVADVDALVNLLNTLLSLARLDGRMDRLQTVPVPLAPLVNALVDELEPLWLSKDLQVSTHGPELRVQGDPEGLRQMFTNLLDNAWKYSPVGGSVRLEWQALDGGEEVRIAVSNSGNSIPEGDLERIFRRFFRSPVGQTVPGSGLGLSIVLSLARLQGGRVRAFNPEEGGAAFEIVLPCATVEESTEGAPNEPR